MLAPRAMSGLGKENLRGTSFEALARWLDERGEKAYRIKQVFAWVHRPVLEFNDMTDIKKGLREALAEAFDLSLPEMQTKQVSPDGTRKYLFVSPDGGAYEAVYIPEVATGSSTNTLCVSSQTGCAVGCTFCFTASLRKNRNLSTAEIMGQVHAAMRDVAELGDRGKVTNIVFMGMGEPLLNYEAVLGACRLLTDQRGLNFSSRRVTVSTSGIVPMIARLGEDSDVQLALSLHAASDDIRTRIVPINRKWGVPALIEALRAYPLKPRRRFTIEYVMLGGINDGVEEAHKLADLLSGIPVKLNLLPLNPHERTPHVPPTPEAVFAFQQVLRERGYNVFIRTARGQEIDAACGQLGGLAEKKRLHLEEPSHAAL